MTNLMTWIGPALDVAAVALLAAVLWRLGRDPGAIWGEREQRLQVIFDDLRTLVAQSEGLARELDGKLGEREERLQSLLGEARDLGTTRDARRVAAAPTAAAARTPMPIELKDEWPEREPAPVADPATTAASIEALADAGISVDEIGRRLGVAAAEVRLVIGLKAARAARRRTTVAGEVRAHA